MPVSVALLPTALCGSVDMVFGCAEGYETYMIVYVAKRNTYMIVYVAKRNTGQHLSIKWENFERLKGLK